MPKSTYYYEISKVDTVGFRNAELTEEIKKIFDQHKDRYGVRKMYYGYEKEYESFESFPKALDEYINYYNNERIQRKTKWMPPVKYRITSMCSA